MLVQATGFQRVQAAMVAVAVVQALVGQALLARQTEAAAAVAAGLQ